MATDFSKIGNTLSSEAAQALPKPVAANIKGGFQRKSIAMAAEANRQLEEKKSKEVVAGTANKIDPLPNPLHEYATYTYGLTLYMLAVSEFEELQQLPVDSLSNWKPKHVMISSAGRFNSLQQGTTAGRLPQFLDDFYFENFNLTTVVGLNSQTRGTNAVEISFTIIEPYGLTLLDRLIDASISPQINSENYLAQPYLLDLDFFGASDLGDATVPLSLLKKRFPIKIVEFKIKASSRGSEYAIKAVPFNHSAFFESSVSTPINLEVTATTVGDFFKARAESTIAAQVNALNKDRELNRNRAIRQGAKSADFANRPDALYSAQPFNVNSYTDAVNEWNNLLISRSNTVAGAADSIEFTFSGFGDAVNDIQNSKITMPEAPNRVKAMNAVDNEQVAQSNSSNGLAINSANVQVFNINAGTSIIDVINLVMRNSDYIKKQIVDVKGNKSFKDNTYVNFYKVVPQIVKLKYDTIRKRYATKTIYHIVYYRYFNSRHPNLPYVNPTSAVKVYNYIYTGKNLDIIDFSIDFDAAYVTTVVAVPGNINAGNNLVDRDDGNDSINPDRERSKPGEIAPAGIEAVSQDASAGALMTRTGEEHLVANAISSIYSNARGDMINVRMKIIGDPHFIKQDDIFQSPGQPGFRHELVSDNGAICTDYSDVFCRINFKTPSDIDEATGLMKSNGAYAVSKFSGFYKILRVTSEFSKGQFEQTIDCVRMVERNLDKSAVQRTEPVVSADSRQPTVPLAQQYTAIAPNNVVPNIRKLDQAIEAKAKAVVKDRFSQESPLDQARKQTQALLDARKNRNN